jgi:flagellar motor component MotA
MDNFMAAAGFVSSFRGIFVANIVATPRAAQVGTIIARRGVVLLAIVAERQLLA